MTLNEAIRIVKWELPDEDCKTGSRYETALIIAVQAMVAWADYRKEKTPTRFYLLPEETEV